MIKIEKEDILKICGKEAFKVYILSKNDFIDLPDAVIEEILWKIKSEIPRGYTKKIKIKQDILEDFIKELGKIKSKYKDNEIRISCSNYNLYDEYDADGAEIYAYVKLDYKYDDDRTKKLIVNCIDIFKDIFKKDFESFWNIIKKYPNSHKLVNNYIRELKLKKMI